MSDQKHKTDKETFKIKGPVKQVKWMRYKEAYHNGKIVPGEILDIEGIHWLYGFDKEGNFNQYITFGPDGKYTQKIYDDNSLLNVSEEIAPDGSCLKTTEQYYDENGLLLGSSTIDAFGKVISKTTRQYNEQGLLIEFATYTNDELNGRHEYDYNPAGQKVEQRVFDKNEGLKYKFITTYTNNGKDETTTCIDLNRKTTNVRTTHLNNDGQYVGSTNNGRYSDHSKRHDAEYEYEYDHHDNWISCKKIENGQVEGFEIREFTYYNEPSEQTILTHTEFEKDLTPTMVAPILSGETKQPTPEQWQWIAEGATDQKPLSPERYYAAVFGSIPSHSKLNDGRTELGALHEHLIDKHGAIDIYYKSYGLHHDTQYTYYVLSFPREQYLLVANNISHSSSGKYLLEYQYDPDIIEANNWLQFGELVLYFPAQQFGDRAEAFEYQLKEIIRKFRVPSTTPEPSISMVVTAGSSFSLKSFPVKDDFEIHDLDLHYGNGFEKFHASLIGKLQSQKKGLILLHGEPGTGKTFYIRHLLRYMAKSNKVVIYMPPNMVDHLIQPAFLTFIANTMSNYAVQGKSCVLLIEDAEPLLAMRESTGRVQAITNLLNMTDGLLNDLLNVQIICTFNVELKKLDSALLRPGRLIARKEFGRLPAFEANILANHLGIKYVFEDEVTISEIYAKLAEQDTLLHLE